MAIQQPTYEMLNLLRVFLSGRAKVTLDSLVKNRLISRNVMQHNLAADLCRK